MSNTYQAFNLDQVLSVLNPNKGWIHANTHKPEDLLNTKEHVFDFPLKGTSYVVRVFTSVHVDTGWTRDCGKDAIRVCVPKRLKSVRVYRTEGWQDRLRTRVMEVIAEVRAGDNKPKVAPMSLSKLPALLTLAHEKLKYPKIRFANPGVLIYRAGGKSKYEGQIMVTDGGSYGDSTYFGRIDMQGIFHRAPKCTDDIAIFLSALNEDPAGIAAEYGKETGQCCFCHKGLTTSESLSVGYGPVCAKHYHLPWGAVA